MITFLMVFFIQNTQARDTQALQLKLDELIRVDKTARNSLISLEERSESEVEEIKSAFGELPSAGDLPVEAPAPSVRRGPVAAESRKPS
jgi:low affinity Fe/Cu permease